ncbi:uncharacterized protein MYCGRDRAFT_91993 [Zymoseptoria tritici IPO323]|uniref:Ig-like domain-containing protein n=1 Tax=Zymoseptoria tritici (strain CBS 115943 / IPO323) TaxID=336722 RepID=F9X593_ZYMTI|nr:uncharacterized protein MYCGRDRAFT_91993 [Zymoseptoria tritici IPO323]EGP88987.1 hypothetical protein MYCGRDRAFT_91993 [Zymoseptoria tritici IPO323]
MNILLLASALLLALGVSAKDCRPVCEYIGHTFVDRTCLCVPGMISQLDWTERIVVAAGKRMAATGSLTAEFDERSGGDALRWRTAYSREMTDNGRFICKVLHRESAESAESDLLGQGIDERQL